MTITASLLLRESSAVSLTAIVERSQQRRPPHSEYDLRLHQTQLELVQTSCPPPPPTPLVKSSSPTDEGFESDIDSLSIVSSDDSFTTANPHHLENPTPKTETDSANGSACSDSDEVDSTNANQKRPVGLSVNSNEIYDLVNCVCYSDVKFPDLLLFVIKEQVLVFKFDNLDVLNGFYSNFNALKAVTNQKTYGKTINTKGRFNLLQRTDNNGVTHIEVSRRPDCKVIPQDEPTSIISIDAPDFKGNGLRKVWRSAENLLGDPKKPERRKRPKGKAPEPPKEKNDVLKGEYVRINVPKVEFEKINLNQEEKLNRPFNILGNVKPKLTTYQQFKYSEPKRIIEAGGTLTRNRINVETWTNSMPRLTKNQRSKSETRSFTPMAYRYIDTANSPMYHRRYQPGVLMAPAPNANNQISTRLFGMSGKLREFGRCDQIDIVKPVEGRWGSLSELNHKLHASETNLKSVIKKDENTKRKNEKKVTFSAYTTVQVV